MRGIGALALAMAACASPDVAPGAESSSAAPSASAASASAASAATAASAASAASANASAAPDGMVELPAAFYMMGAPFGTGDAEERPMHEVTLAAFWLDRTEVTVSAYRACVTAGACPHTPRGPFCNETDPTKDAHPINCVDWAAANAHCTWAGKRLPSEREWEYAASGGNDKRRFAWGEEEPDGTRACYSHAGTCAVGSFPATAFGLLDLSGNVWEWTSTWFGPYPDEAAAGGTRVYRGGSWSRRFPKWLRNTLRNRFKPEQWSASLGFRCARTRTPLVCPDQAAPHGDGCVRAQGTPGCEPGFAWNGRTCALGGRASDAAALRALLPAAAQQPQLPPRPQVAAGEAASPDAAPSGSASGDGSSASNAAPALSPDRSAAISRSREPGFDADCRAHYAGKPAAHRISGGTFHDREPVVRASGCSKRDVGRTWTSVCCAE